jgi:multimeric flavodoxin WrbA
VQKNNTTSTCFRYHSKKFFKKFLRTDRRFPDAADDATLKASSLVFFMQQETSSTPLKVTVIVGGTNDPSNSDFLANHFIKGLEEAKVTVTKIRLKDLKIDHFDLKCYDKACTETDEFPAVRKAIMNADGLVFASPVWNFSVPAHLKNVIDRMGSFALDDTHSVGMMNRKPAFLILTGGIPGVGWPLLKRTTSHIPAAIEYFGGAVLGTYFEGRCTKGRGIFGLVVDQRPESLKAVQAKGVHFATQVKIWKESGKLPFFYALKLSGLRFGQKMKRSLGI